MGTQSLSLFLFELAAIIFAAKLGGELCERYLKQSAVLGELAMGMIIGPYALGRLPLPGIGTPFSSHCSASRPGGRGSDL